MQFASALLGLTLSNGWRAVEHLPKSGAGMSGSVFSEGYIVEGPGGQRAFLKALDFSTAFAQGPNFTNALAAMTNAYNYERDLLLKCRDLKLDRRILRTSRSCRLDSW